MTPSLIDFRETHLDENNKFTSVFLDHEFVQETEFNQKTNIILRASIVN